MNRSPENDRYAEALKAQLRTLEMRKPYLNEVLSAFGPLLMAGASIRCQLDALPAPEMPLPPSDRLAAGMPLLSGVRFQETDLPVSTGLKEMLKAVGSAFPALGGHTDRLLRCFRKNPQIPAKWLETLIQDRENSPAPPAEALRMDSGTFRFAVEQALKPFLRWLAEHLSHRIEEIRWDRGYCPVCGAHPDTSCLRKPAAPPDGLTGHGGRRWLHCSRCSHQWRFHRVACPHCGNGDAGSMEYFGSKEAPHERLYVCHRCQRYLTCLDTTELIDPPAIDLIPFELLHLELVAAEKGFKPKAHSPIVL